MNLTIEQIDPRFSLNVLALSASGALQIQQIDAIFGVGVAPGSVLSLALSITPPIALTMGVPGSLPGPPGPQGQTGPAGATGAGETGATGPQGIAGPEGPEVATYVFDQGMPAALWVINHDLQRFPAVIVSDSTGRIVEGDVVYVSANTVTVQFQAAFSGTAYIN